MKLNNILSLITGFSACISGILIVGYPVRYSYKYHTVLDYSDQKYFLGGVLILFGIVLIISSIKKK